MKRAIITFSVYFLFSLWGYAQSPEVLNSEGVRLGTRGNYKTADKYFERALAKYDKESAKLIHNIGWVHEQEGDDEKAIKAYDEALKRNPNQVHTLERAGYLYFAKKNYDRAILYGERALAINSENQEILKWISNAYSERFRLKKEGLEEKSELEELKKMEAALKKEKESKKPDTLKAELDFVVRSVYDKDKTDFDYVKTRGYGPDIPFNIFLDFTPGEVWRFRLDTGIPYEGTLFPEILQWRERLELLIRKKSYYLGVGLMGNHFSGTMPSIGNEKLNDFKVGFVFGKSTSRSELDIRFYPRLFPADTGVRGGESFDVNMLDVNYSYRLNQQFTIDFGLYFSDYYFFNHGREMSDYYGRYDFKIGFFYGDRAKSPYSLGVYFTERFYMEDLENDSPYDIGNGQGLGGFNIYKWFKGDPISGVNTASHVITLELKQHLADNFYIYQDFIAEIVSPGRPRNEFALKLGVGGGF